MKRAKLEIEPAPLPLARTLRRRFVVTPLAIFRRKRGLFVRRLRGWLAGAGRAEAGGAGPRFDVSGFHAQLQELERIAFAPEVMAAVEQTAATPLVMPAGQEARAPAGTERLGWPRRARPAPVYEVLPFDMELDLLEIRLHELQDLVDAFVVVESALAYGCVRKPLFLARNWDRFRAFHHKMIRLEVEGPDVAQVFPDGRRGATDWTTEVWLRDQMWRKVRGLGLPSETVVISSDADEMLPRNAVYLLKHYQCVLPLRFVLSTLRYHFRWFDAETPATITAFSPASFQPGRDAPVIPPETPRFAMRGAAHFTSFLPPEALIAKMARTTDWEPGIEALIRNDHGEVARMMAEGRWLNSWALRQYDADEDPLGLVPGFARANRARYPRFWGGRGGL